MKATDARATAILAVLGLLLGWIAWRAVTLGLADHFAGTDPQRALAWRPAHPQALLTRAQFLAGGTTVAAPPAERRDPQAAAGLARRALRADPLPGAGWRVLGQVADAAGDRDGAARLYAIAGERSPRDLDAHVWLVDHHLARQ